MIIDQVPDGAILRSDVCIIGGGPAGITLALAVGRDPTIGVCLIESGGARFEADAQDLGRTEVIGLPLAPIHEARVRALGGSTWSWGGICTAQDAITFEDRPWVDGAWPFPMSELDAYLDRAMRSAGITPDITVADVADTQATFEASGLDPAVLAPIPVHFSRPVRFGRAYGRRLAGSPNVDTYLHATITGLEADGGRVVAANGISRGRPFRIEARRFVLAGGGIENPRLLLASKIGNDLVGRFFMEHPRRLDRFTIRSGDTPISRLVRGGRHRRESARLRLTDAVQRRERLLDWHADLHLGHVGQAGSAWSAARRLYIASRRPWNESPYYQDAGGGRLGLRRRDVLSAMRRPDQTLLGLAAVMTGHPSLRRTLEVWSSIEQAPDPANRVELAEEVDSLGVPRPRIVWGVGEIDERTYRVGRTMLLEELRRLEPGLTEIDSGEDAWPAGILGTWHHLGTTRMHDDPARGVVDRDARVHGMDNLFVAGSSVFPVSGAASPTITLIELSLRLADHLAREMAAVPAVTA